MEYATLNNGVQMPRVGYGVYQLSSEECERCVLGPPWKWATAPSTPPPWKC